MREGTYASVNAVEKGRDPDLKVVPVTTILHRTGVSGLV